MNILCVIVTHNRFAYTQQAVQAWGHTANDEDHLVIVDNASSDGTGEWLDDYACEASYVIRNRRNLFPGAATNIGWHAGIGLFGGITHLMRLDNDMQLLPGWRQEAERCFNADPKLGMLGFHNRWEDYAGEPPTELDEHGMNTHWDQVGGNAIIPRAVYDQGFRWMCGAWKPGATDEDSVGAAWVREHGWHVRTVIPTVCNNLSFHRYNDYPAYYDRTAGLRGLVPQLSV